MRRYIAAMSRRLVVGVLLVLACANAGEPGDKRRSSETAGAHRAVVLAHLISGRWIENPFYSHNDFENLRLLLFKDVSLLVDSSYVDSLADPCACTVKRTRFYFGREVSSGEVGIPCDEFWAKVNYVQRYMDEHKVVPVNPVVVPLSGRVDPLQKSR